MHLELPAFFQCANKIRQFNRNVLSSQHLMLDSLLGIFDSRGRYDIHLLELNF